MYEKMSASAGKKMRAKVTVYGRKDSANIDGYHSSAAGQIALM
jgi:hypothetical protein